MGKKTAVAETAVARDAKVLAPYDVTLIKRMGQLKVLKDRVEKLLTKLHEKLDPNIDSELQVDGPDCTKATVNVGTQIVEVGRTDRTTLLYKKVAEKELTDACLDKYRADPDFTATSAAYRGKLLGKGQTVEQLLKS